MAHKYRLQQRVRLVNRASKTNGAFEIIRILPTEQGKPTYRIKLGNEERAVRESEIAPAL